MTTEGESGPGLLVPEAAMWVRPVRALTPNEARDVYLELLELFEIPASAEGSTQVSYLDEVDERDALLLEALLQLCNLRFPMMGSPSAAGLEDSGDA